MKAEKNLPKEGIFKLRLNERKKVKTVRKIEVYS